MVEYIMQSCTLAGAMRLPKRPDDPDKTHYLTDYYAAKEFKLGLAPFKNYDEDAYLEFYDKKNIKISGKYIASCVAKQLHA